MSDMLEADDLVDILHLDAGLLVFPRGLKDFCAREGIDALFISQDTDMTAYTHGATDWVTLPKEQPARVTPIQIRRNKDGDQDNHS